MLNYDLNALQNAISDKTRLIMAVNLLGNPNDYGAIQKMISGKNIYLIEDNCESLEAEFDRKMAGAISLMGYYSTFFSHHMATMEGDPICTDDKRTLSYFAKLTCPWMNPESP